MLIEDHHEGGPYMPAYEKVMFAKLEELFFLFFQVPLVMKIIHCQLLKKHRGYKMLEL